MLFVFYLAFVLVVLGMGAVSAYAAHDEALHTRLHDLALEEGALSRAATRMADAAHDTPSVGQLALDYAFSLVNLGLALFLFWLRPKGRTAPLLAFALAGTAGVFNLQAHRVYEEIEPSQLETLSHDGFHVVAAAAYVGALLLFPDGKLVPRWRPLPLALFYAALIPVLGIIAFAAQGATRTLTIVMFFGLIAPITGVLSQAYRYGRSQDPVAHQQSRLLFWALLPALAVALFALTAGVNQAGTPQLEGREILELPVEIYRAFQPVFLIILVALFVGVLRFRLWSVDKLISRTLVYGVLAGFVTAVYVGVVVGVGSLIGQRRDGNIGLSVVATFLVAVAFDPVKSRVQKLANRLVYGKRATPYEVLSEFSERVAEAAAAEEVLDRMARVLAEGTAAERVDVWLKVGDEMRVAATYPSEGVAARPPLRITGPQIPWIEGVTRAVAVRHQGELFGALSLVKKGQETLTVTEEKLLDDLARQAGLVLKNVRLTADLRARLDELKVSRQRLVSAQDEERRKFERNLHDGAQQQLVALKVHLTLAEDIADELGPPGEPLLEILDLLKTQAGEALEELRSLGRGIYPPLLAAEGLATALANQARKSGMPVTVTAPEIGRYPQDVEAAVYFVCLEALQNISKYANASAIEVRLAYDDGHLVFSVIDDGVGFDPDTALLGMGCNNMRDRVEALDGTITITSTPGTGTTISGRIPVEPLPAAAPTVGAPAAHP